MSDLVFNDPNGRLNVFNNEGWVYGSRKNTPYNKKPDAVQMIGIVTSQYAGEHRVVIIQQTRKSINEPIWEFPAGMIDDGETPVQAAIREFKEETGMTFTPTHQGQNTFPSAGIIDENVINFIGHAYGTPNNLNNVHDEDISIYLKTIPELYWLCQSKNVNVTSSLASFAYGAFLGNIFNVKF